MYVKYTSAESDKEHVITCARLCASRAEFQKGFKKEYFRAFRKGYLEEACSHMARGGALGGNSVRWTLARVTEEAKLYRTRSEFRDKSAGAYAAARMGGFLDTVCKHMPTPPEWDRSKVLAVAARCSSRRQFKLDHQKAYEAARYLKMLPELRFESGVL